MSYASSIHTILLDIDGVVLDEKIPISRVDEAIYWFLHQGIEMVFITNNVNTPRGELIRRLEPLMIGHRFQLIDPIDVLEKAIEKCDINSQLIYVVGTDVFKNRLRQLNIEIIDWDDSLVVPSAILIGSSMRIAYNELAYLSQLVNSGVEFWATGQESVFKWSGQVWPSTGAILAFIETATDRKANILGKPSSRIFELATGDTNKEQILVIGDDIDIDIAGAQGFGLKNVLVMSGITSKEKLKNSNQGPDLVVDSLYELIDVFSR